MGLEYSDMKRSEKKVAEFLTKLDLSWVYQFPVFVYDAENRPRVWTPDFYVPELGMYIEVCGSQKFNYKFREKIYEKNRIQVIFIHLYKDRKKWENYLLVRIKEIEELRYSEVMKMLQLAN